MKVCILGVGAMGSAMATNLLGKEFDACVWDRTWERSGYGDRDVSVVYLALTTSAPLNP